MENEILLNVLNNIIKQDKISHAYLFYGEEGVGKKTIAKFFAQSIFCNGLKKPCGVCSSCIKFSKSSHVDFLEIGDEYAKGQSFNIEDVRRLIEYVNVKPNESKFKIVLLSCVDSLLKTSANALLKILEDPPRNVIFLLTANFKNKVLKTILSRCIHFFVAPVSNESCLKFLYDLKLDKTKKELQEISALSQGVLGTAKYYATTKMGEKVLKNSLILFEVYLHDDELSFSSILQKNEKNLEITYKSLKCFLERVLLFLESQNDLNYELIKKSHKTCECTERAILNLNYNVNLSIYLMRLSCEIFSD